MKISLTSVFVDDPGKAFKFYTEVLGFVGRMYVPEAYSESCLWDESKSVLEARQVLQEHWKCFALNHLFHI